jgi:hypothetical protein
VLREDDIEESRAVIDDSKELFSVVADTRGEVGADIAPLEGVEEEAGIVAAVTAASLIEASSSYKGAAPDGEVCAGTQ